MNLDDLIAQAYAEITMGMHPEILRKEKPGLERFAFAIAVNRESEARIKNEGLVVSDEKGRPVPHPALAIQRSSAKDIEGWLKQYRRLLK